MKYLFFALSLLVAPACFTQAQSIEEEINTQVWSPFIKAYSDFDTPAFMAVHTDDIIRVDRDGSGITVGSEYADAMLESAVRNKERGAKRSISLSFLERIHTDNYGFEVGYYQVVYAADGLQRISYGKFHVVLKKTRGKWKILVDSDTSLNNSISEEDFMQGEVMVR